MNGAPDVFLIEAFAFFAFWRFFCSAWMMGWLAIAEGDG